MRYRLRHLDLDDKMCQHVSLEIIEQIYPQEIICDQLSLHDAWEERERVLNMFVVIHLLLAAALWTRLAFPRVLERLARPLHVLGLPLKTMQVTGSALSYRRHQFGRRPPARTVCSLLSAPVYACHPGCLPLRQSADGTMQDVADTPANAAEFSRPRNQYGAGPFPQIRLLLLTECGSHATLDATISDGTHAERRVAEDLVPSLEPDMLLLHDAQFTGLRFWQAIRARKAHVMGPLPSHHLPTYLRHLSDGSYLAVYLPSKKQEQEGIKPLLVGVIEYRITDARLGEPEQIYRLATTWLNPRTAPALDLIDCYHERWEVEGVLDEIKTHQRLQQPVLRSRTPEGVRQEVYALLLAHYAVRSLMHRAACQAGVDPHRLSFTDALFVLCETTRELAQVERSQQDPLRQEMYARLTSHVLPARQLRANPRVLKKLYRKYKRKSHDQPTVPPFDPMDQFLGFVVLLI